MRRHLPSYCCLLLALGSAGAHAQGPPAGASVGGPTSPGGQEIQVDLPHHLHLKNKGGSDQAGLCVFTSIDHSSKWQGVRQLDGFRDWMTQHPGGGWPQKVDQMIARISQERGMPKPKYVQVESNDLDILRLACRSGRFPAVTYGVSPTGRYGGKRIGHMVSLTHADGDEFAVLDNNYIDPRGQAYEWMSEKEFLRSYAAIGGQGWSVILLAPPPPPPPRN